MFITCNNLFPTQKCILSRPVYMYYPLKLIVYRKNMEVIKPLHLTPLFDRAPDGPSAYSIVQLDNGGTSDITHWVLVLV